LIDPLIQPLGIPSSAIKIAKTPFIFARKAIIFPRLFMYQVCMHDKLKECYGKIADFYSNPLTKTPKLIYISREFVPKRKLLNENKCIDLFKKYQFEIIHPEELSLQEQIDIFSKATHVAGPIGSGMHNLLFNHSSATKSLFIAPRQFPGLYPTCLIETFYGRTASICYGSNAPRNYSADFSVDLRNLDTAIQQWMEAI
jgi:capsular polysaccharide biosynthesis protein